MNLRGWEGVLAGDVPLGAGLSSSAALEMATARAFAAVSGMPWDAVAQAKLGQRRGKQVDRRELRHHGPVDLLDRPSGPCHAHRLPVAGVAAGAAAGRRGGRGPRHGDAAGAGRFGLQRRRRQCEAAAAFFQVRALRDVTVALFEAKAGQLDATTRRRARHVITEDDRTLRAVEAMRRGDIATLGRLMNESHVSLRDDYEVSSDALNAMVEAPRPTRPATAPA